MLAMCVSATTFKMFVFVQFFSNTANMVRLGLMHKEHLIRNGRRFLFLSPQTQLEIVPNVSSEISGSCLWDGLKLSWHHVKNFRFWCHEQGLKFSWLLIKDISFLLPWRTVGKCSDVSSKILVDKSVSVSQTAVCHLSRLSDHLLLLLLTSKSAHIHEIWRWCETYSKNDDVTHTNTCNASTGCRNGQCRRFILATGDLNTEKIYLTIVHLHLVRNCSASSTLTRWNAAFLFYILFLNDIRPTRDQHLCLNSL